MNWKTVTSTLSLVGVCLLISAPGAIAQGASASPGKGPAPAGAPGGRGAMSQMTPEQQAKAAAWKKWSDAHKPLRDLSMLIRKVGQLDKEPATALTKPQATKLIGIIKPWQTKTTMSNDQANGVMKSVTAILTPAQVAKLATMQGGRGGGGMGGGNRRGGGMAGPGANPGAPVAVGGAAAAPRPGMSGPRVMAAPPVGKMPAGYTPQLAGAGGGGGFKFPDPPKTPYNPLNPATLPEQQPARAKKNLDGFMAALQAKK